MSASMTVYVCITKYIKVYRFPMLVPEARAETVIFSLSLLMLPHVGVTLQSFPS